MGYYTDYKVEAELVDNDDFCRLKDFCEKVNKAVDYPYFLDYEDDSEVEGLCSSYWTSKKPKGFILTLFKELCKEYPDISVEIEGIGEDTGDWWIARIKGEEFKYAKAISPREILEKQEE